MSNRDSRVLPQRFSHRHIPTLNPEFPFRFNSHFCTSLSHFAVVRFLSSLSYTFTLVRLVAGFNLGANVPSCINVYIYALFTCSTSSPHCVLRLNLHHHHKVLQHIEVLC